MTRLTEEEATALEQLADEQRMELEILRPWGKRMHDALEAIADGVERYIEDGGESGLTADDVIQIARRAVHPDEWERASD